MYTRVPLPALGRPNPNGPRPGAVPQASREPTVAGAAPQRSDRTRTRPAGVPAPYPAPRRLRPPCRPANLSWGPSRLSSAVDPEPWDRMNRLSLVVGTLLVPLRLAAQDSSVTLGEAIRLAERTQPGVIQAQGQVETAAAQRRSAWGAFLPSVTASSSASDFYSQGASRIDPLTGQVLSGNTTNRSVNASLRASV